MAGARPIFDELADLSDILSYDLPTNNSPLSIALGLKADTASLSTVATTGAYSDLTGTPTIPSATQVVDYLVDDGIHTITSTAGVATPDAANGRSQKFPLTENVTDFNPPTSLADGQSMLIQILQDATPRTLTLDAAWKVIGSGVASDIGSLTSGQYAWLSVSRYGADYLISITAEA